MATVSNTSFKVQNGLYVVGNSYFSHSLEVANTLTVTGSLEYNGEVIGDFVPQTDNYYNIGNTSFRWLMYGSTVDFITVNSNTVTTNNFSTKNAVPNANGNPLGVTDKRWDVYANSIVVNTTSVQTLLTVYGNSTSNVFAVNTSQATIKGNTVIMTKGGSTVHFQVTGNSTSVNVDIKDTNTTTVAGNVAFDTDLLYIDALNNRIGVKNTAPGASSLITVAGNVELRVANGGLRFNDSTWNSVNASIVLLSDGSNTRLTFTTYDMSTASVQDGGYEYKVANSTGGLTSLLTMNLYDFKYKSANVAHAGNFGIYDVNGTRVGP